MRITAHLSAALIFLAGGEMAFAENVENGQLPSEQWCVASTTDDGKRNDRSARYAGTRSILPNGVKLTVTSPDARQATRLKALGFRGIMVQGAHHQRHHLMMAKGELTHYSASR